MSSVVVTSNLYLVNKLSKAAMVKAAISVGLLTSGYAQDLCPVDTGNLRNSITHAYSEENGKVELDVGCLLYPTTGVPTFYAPWVELGHHQQVGRYVPAIGKRLVRGWVPGKPFLRPAFENHTSEIEQVILDSFND